MKKILVSVLVSLTVLMQSFSLVNAAGAGAVITEVPNFRLAIEGKFNTFQEPVISVEKRNLLPLRELLVSLGVQNDDEHILWNERDKSVTIYKDTTKIVLKQGDSTAYVNDAPVKLDVAPLLYAKNQRIYIPIRFVAQTLGKKVAWDPSTSTAFIRDEAKFNEIKTIMDKSAEAMKAVKKYKAAMNMDIGMNQGNMKLQYGIKMAAEIDLTKQLLHTAMDMNLFGIAMKTENYSASTISYSQNPTTGKWEKEAITPAEFAESVDQSGMLSATEASDVLYASMILQPDTGSGEIILKSNTYQNSQLTNTLSGNTTGLTDSPASAAGNYEWTLSLDKSTYRMNKISISMSESQTKDNMKMDITVAAAITYSDFDGSFEIVIPDEVVKNATEKAESSDSPLDFLPL